MASILIVGKEDIVRKGLVELLRPTTDFRILADVRDAAAAGAMARGHRIETIVYATTDSENCTEIVRELANCSPSSAILVLASSAESQDVIGAVRAGARGFLTLSSEVSNLISAIRSLAKGEVAFSKTIMLHIINSFSSSADMPVAIKRNKPETSLTPREVEVLALVSKGANNFEVAETLVISPHTVRAHMRNILDKLRVENRVQAATWAERMGLVKALVVVVATSVLLELGPIANFVGDTLA